MFISSLWGRTVLDITVLPIGLKMETSISLFNRLLRILISPLPGFGNKIRFSKIVWERIKRTYFHRELPRYLYTIHPPSLHIRQYSYQVSLLLHSCFYPGRD